MSCNLGYVKPCFWNKINNLCLLVTLCWSSSMKGVNTAFLSFLISLCSCHSKRWLRPVLSPGNILAKSTETLVFTKVVRSFFFFFFSFPGLCHVSSTPWLLQVLLVYKFLPLLVAVQRHYNQHNTYRRKHLIIYRGLAYSFRGLINIITVGAW